MTGSSSQGRALPEDLSSIVRAWIKHDRARRNRQNYAVHLRRRQGLGEENKWMRKNSPRAHQAFLLTKRALRDWFRVLIALEGHGGGDGVPVSALVEVIIILGLKTEVKQVQRIVWGKVDTPSGLLSYNGFAAAVLACCSADAFHVDRLLASPWAEEEDPYQEKIKTQDARTIAEGTVLPSLLTRLSAYRRKVLMATVADMFPTPCSSSFWRPGVHRLPRGEQCREASSLYTRPPRKGNTREPSSPSALPQHNASADTRNCANSSRYPSSRASSHLPETDAHSPVPSRSPSLTERRYYEAVREGVFLARGTSNSRKHTVTEEQPMHERAPLAKITPSSPSTRMMSTPRGLGRGNVRIDREDPESRSNPTSNVDPSSKLAKKVILGEEGEDPCIGKRPPHEAAGIEEEESARARFGAEGRRKNNADDDLDAGAGADAQVGDPKAQQQDFLRYIAAQLRQRRRQEESYMAKSEASWHNYEEVKQRWRRQQTPGRILRGREASKPETSCSRLVNHRPGTGKDRHNGRARGQHSRIRWKPLPLGPITVTKFNVRHPLPPGV